MADKAKLTLETAFDEFPDECMVLNEPFFHQTSELAWAALCWLFERNMWMPAVPVHPDHRDPLRWLLLEVREWRNEHKEEE